MNGLYFTMEWGYTATMHVVDEANKYTPLCSKNVRLTINKANPVEDYRKTEYYLDNPTFEFLDLGDVVTKAIVCEKCMKLASLKLMVNSSQQSK